MTRWLLDIPGMSGSGTPGQWAVIALGVATILYVVVVRPMRKGKSRPDPLERPARLGSLAQQRAVERDMSNLLVEYEEMIRRMTAQVDTRAAKLELLIRDAEETIARLKAALSSAGSAPAAPDDGSPSGGPATDRPDVAAGATDSAHEGNGSERPADATNPARKAQPSEAAPADAGRIDQRHAEVYRLADAGQSARQIAKALDRPAGEVELILALRREPPRREGLWGAVGAAVVGAATSEASSADPGPAAVSVEAPEPTELDGPTEAPVELDRETTPDATPTYGQGRRGRKKHRAQRP